MCRLRAAYVTNNFRLFAAYVLRFFFRIRIDSLTIFGLLRLGREILNQEEE
jgi:hypothetical protein